MKFYDWLGVGLFVGVLVGAITSKAAERYRWEKQAISHGAAQYNSTTGKFEWKEKP